MSASRSGAPRAGTTPQAGRSYGRGAGVLSVGIAGTGLLTFAYFSVSSHVLGEVATKRVDLLWSIMFVVISVIYRPIEQLLSRTIAEQRARGREQHSLRVPIAIQGGFALAFVAAALGLHAQLLRVFNGYSTLYYVLLVGTLAYGASYFARGWLAGHERFGLFGGLVVMESLSRLCFALAVALGVVEGQAPVALGIAAGPLLSLVVIPAAFARTTTRRTASYSEGRLENDGLREGGHGLEADGRLEAALAGPGAEGIEEALDTGELTLGRGSRFAVAVSSVMLSEQVLLNAAVLTVDATSPDRALAGIVFNVLLIARAPLQLFQAIQTSLLPHLAGLQATEGREQFARAIRLTVLSIAAFSGAVALGLLAVGPLVMKGVLFGQRFSYGRFGLAFVGLGMGMHLASGALNQAALARNQERSAALCWLIAAGAFLVWVLLPTLSNQLLRVEVGYLGATTLLALSLAAVYRRGAACARSAPVASSAAR